jgi:hypothetical protein
MTDLEFKTEGARVVIYGTFFNRPVCRCLQANLQHLRA